MQFRLHKQEELTGDNKDINKLIATASKCRLVINTKDIDIWFIVIPDHVIYERERNGVVVQVVTKKTIKSPVLGQTCFLMQLELIMKIQKQ